MADLYSQGRQANNETAVEIIARLEAAKNYIPSSDRVRKEYRHVLLKEYKTYIKGKAGDSQEEAPG
ncbi:MAG: hypothetical protein ACYDH8_07925 [Syntrophales bacterium]